MRPGGKVKAILLAVVFVLVSLPAQAGFVSQYTVVVQQNGDGSGFFDGVMSNTRFTDDSLALIGCRLSASSGDSGPLVLCQATDSDGVGALCFTTDSAIVDSIKAIAAYSYMQVHFDSFGQCTTVLVATRSQYIPEFRDLGLGAPGNSGGRGR